MPRGGCAACAKRRGAATAAPRRVAASAAPANHRDMANRYPDPGTAAIPGRVGISADGAVDYTDDASGCL